MSLGKKFVPVKPFDDFKWQWACLTCTESLNDPVILLGVLSKMRKLEGRKKYSSPEFSQELLTLQNDVSDSMKVNLSGRVGERNLIRNSGQYWKALGLIDDDSRGTIKLTRFGQKVADREISQAEFAATTIKTLKLPNPHVQKYDVCHKWEVHGISFYPLMLILKVLEGLYKRGMNQKYVTGDEMIKIIIPLSGVNAEIDDYVNFILWYRANEIDVSYWPDCCPAANDKRMAREFLLFLNNYGYIKSIDAAGRFETKYILDVTLIDEISEIDIIQREDTLIDTLERIRANDIVSDIERKRVLTYRTERPNQARFRKNIISSFMSKCILTGISMPEVLEAAHIKPVQYKGNDSISNGLCIRLDMHQLFDTGHLRIALDGHIFLSSKARKEYSDSIPEQISIPDFVDRGFLKWRWDNYNSI